MTRRNSTTRGSEEAEPWQQHPLQRRGSAGVLGRMRDPSGSRRAVEAELGAGAGVCRETLARRCASVRVRRCERFEGAGWAVSSDVLHICSVCFVPRRGQSDAAW